VSHDRQYREHIPRTIKEPPRTIKEPPPTIDCDQKRPARSATAEGTVADTAEIFATTARRTAGEEARPPDSNPSVASAACGTKDFATGGIGARRSPSQRTLKSSYEKS